MGLAHTIVEVQVQNPQGGPAGWRPREEMHMWIFLILETPVLSSPDRRVIPNTSFMTPQAGPEQMLSSPPVGGWNSPHRVSPNHTARGCTREAPEPPGPSCAGIQSLTPSVQFSARTSAYHLLVGCTENTFLQGPRPQQSSLNQTLKVFINFHHRT